MTRIRHVVLVRFKSDLPAAEIEGIWRDLHALKETIPGILAVNCGRSVSPEGLEKGFAHGFVMDFADEAARDGYLPHPEHVKAAQRLVAACEGGVDGVLVIDLALR